MGELSERIPKILKINVELLNISNYTQQRNETEKRDSYLRRERQVIRDDSETTFQLRLHMEHGSEVS